MKNTLHDGFTEIVLSSNWSTTPVTNDRSSFTLHLKYQEFFLIVFSPNPINNEIARAIVLTSCEETVKYPQ
jgi:hypothetical protein